MVMRDDLDANECQVLLLMAKHDRDLLLTIATGLALVSSGCVFWIVAAIVVTQLTKDVSSVIQIVRLDAVAMQGDNSAARWKRARFCSDRDCQEFCV